MPKAMMQGFIITILTMILAGCGVQAKRYVEVRERLDQQMVGNAGYLSGTPKEAQLPEEVTASEPKRTYTSSYDSIQEPAVEPAPSRRIILPDFDEPSSAPAEEHASDSASSVSGDLPTDYTIEKNDTLQKISKKFYGTYSKWTKIYDTNKERIPDPNRIKPGVTITIPAI